MPRGRKTKLTGEVQPECKAVAKKSEKTVTEAIIVQSAGTEWNVAEIRERVIAAYVAEGHRWGRVRELTLYLKPEEHKVYYVINGKINGCVEIEG